MIQGVILALVTGLLWAIGPMCFASIGRKIGSFRVLVLGRLFGALLLLVTWLLYAPFVTGSMQLPTFEQFIWIAVSSILGMVVGDALLYEAFVTLGPRRSTQVLMLSPIFSTGTAWFFMGETLGIWQLLGVVTVMSAVAVAVLSRTGASGADREPGKLGARGILFALVATALIGIGAVAVRYAFLLGPLDPIQVSFTRVAIAAGLLFAVPLVQGRSAEFLRHLKDPWILPRFIPGVIAGPAVGIICYVASLRLIEAGLVSTLSQTSPLFMLPMVWYRYKAKIGIRVLIATLVALAGVALICWKPRPTTVSGAASGAFASHDLECLALADSAQRIVFAQRIAAVGAPGEESP